MNKLIRSSIQFGKSSKVTSLMFPMLLRLNKPFNSYGNMKTFSTGSNNSDIDKDFQPEIKKELNDENIQKQIDEWVKGNDVVLFMKGTKEMPRCGFSNYLIQILKFYKIKNIKDINVLESDLIRQAVKDYSNWPTFPQLYVKGELIGGCDIVKEMHENGKFEELCQRNNLI
jgi:monothiol glutaredoxin